MIKYITSNGTFYYPEWRLNLIDTEEIKIIVENPTGYVEGDSVRMFYSTEEEDDVVIGVNTFEMFSPLVRDGSILRAVFFIPLSIEIVSESSTFMKDVHFFIKTKGSTDFTESNTLHDDRSIFFLTQDYGGARSNPIPVFFFSERGAGLFENRILNRQLRVADTNFSSVAIRQDKFNPFVMDIGGRNLVRKGRIQGYGDSVIQEDGMFDGIPKFVNTVGSGGTFGFQYVSSIPAERPAGTWITLSFKVFVRTFDSPTNMGGYVSVNNDGATTSEYGFNSLIPDLRLSENQNRWVEIVHTFLLTKPITSINRFYFWRSGVLAGDLDFTAPKLELGNKATDYTPNPEDYEVTEVVSGADLAGGLAKFNSSYAFKLLDDSEWVTKKLICPENYIQLFWGEPRSETRFSFWFKIKEIEKSSEAWGEVEHYRELRAGTDVKERRKEVTKYRFPKTKLRLTSGVFRQDIIDKLKGIAHSTTIFKYNPYTKLNEGRGVIAQVTEIRGAADGLQTPQLGTGHFKLNDLHTDSNTIEELINSPESVFDLEFSFKGTLRYVDFIQNRDKSSKYATISNTITESNFTKKTFNSSIVIDRSRKVKPMIRFGVLEVGTTEIKDIYIKGSLGGIEDVEVEIATMNIIPHQDGESEMELTVISDDFRKPDYLYF